MEDSNCLRRTHSGSSHDFPFEKNHDQQFDCHFPLCRFQHTNCCVSPNFRVPPLLEIDPKIQEEHNSGLDGLSAKNRHSSKTSLWFDECRVGITEGFHEAMRNCDLHLGIHGNTDCEQSGTATVQAIPGYCQGLVYDLKSSGRPD